MDSEERQACASQMLMSLMVQRVATDHDGGLKTEMSEILRTVLDTETMDVYTVRGREYRHLYAVRFKGSTIISPSYKGGIGSYTATSLLKKGDLFFAEGYSLCSQRRSPCSWACSTTSALTS